MICAGVIPYITKPSAASKLAEAEHPVACPPRWLPVLLASLEYSTSPAKPWEGPELTVIEPISSCSDQPFNESDITSQAENTATMVPARVSLNGVQVGWPIGDRGGPNECDQVAAFGEDGDLRGVSKLINNYFSLGFFGDPGDWIEFRYYIGAQNQSPDLLLERPVFVSGQRQFGLLWLCPMDRRGLDRVRALRSPSHDLGP